MERNDFHSHVSFYQESLTTKMYLGILCHISSPHSKSYNFLPEINIGQYYLEIANGWHCKRSTGRCQRPFRTHREQSFRFQIIWNVINRRRRRWLVPTISPVSIASSSPSSFAHKFKMGASIHPSQVDTLWQPRSIRSTSTCIRTWGRHQDESTLSKLETTPIYVCESLCANVTSRLTLFVFWMARSDLECFFIIKFLAGWDETRKSKLLVVPDTGPPC